MNPAEKRQLSRVKRQLREAQRTINQAVEEVTFATTEFDAGRFEWEELRNITENAITSLTLVGDLVDNIVAEVPPLPDDVSEQR